MIFDTHIHFNDDKLIKNIDHYLQEAIESGVNRFLCVGWDIPSSKKAVEIANKYENIYAAIGIIPTSHEEFNDKSIDELREMAKDPKVVAIGEIGLDYYWEKEDEIKNKQKEMFIKQILLANELKLPISVHCRDAIGDCLEIVKNFHVERKSVLHCYQGSLESAKEFIKENFVISFGGTLTYKNSVVTKEVLLGIDESNIVFETDAPYLAPQNHRGETNEPKFICDVVKFASEYKKVEQKLLEKTTFETACKIFSRGKFYEN